MLFQSTLGTASIYYLVPSSFHKEIDLYPIIGSLLNYHIILLHILYTVKAKYKIT